MADFAAKLGVTLTHLARVCKATCGVSAVDLFDTTQPETRTVPAYLSDVDRSVCLPCPRKVRVGANSPSRWPTMFSVT